MPGLVTLDAPPYVIDRGEAQPGDVEAVKHSHGLGQAGAQRRGVAPVGVQRRHADTGPPPRISLIDPADQRGRAAVGDDIE